jgi:tetratricopeptide (TPR) repeat protein
MNLEKYRHYYRARFFESFRRPALAIEAYRLALHHAPDFFEAATGVALLYTHQEQYERAEPYYKAALRINPGHADTHFNLGYVYDLQGKREPAIACFTESVRLKPKLDRAWYGMGMAYAALGQHDEAAKALEEAARLQPMNTCAWYALGMAYHHVDNAERVKEIALYLHRIGPISCRQLVRESRRSDLQYLIDDMVV